eukprot:37506_1
MADSKKLRAKTGANCTNKTSVQLPISIKMTTKQNKSMTTNPYPRQMRNVSAVSDVYRPSFFDGTYGSYKYRTFESFQFPRNDIKTNVTSTNVNNVPMKCELLKNFDHTKYFDLRNGTKIQINKELHVLLSLSSHQHSVFGQDFYPLLYDHFSRFAVISEINK